ncbi:unnamed protein product, partial [Heterosigma akashiwo]
QPGEASTGLRSAGQEERRDGQRIGRSEEQAEGCHREAEDAGGGNKASRGRGR